MCDSVRLLYLLTYLLTYLQVRKAHRNLAMRHHPDKVGDSAEAQQKMARLNWAKDVLLKREQSEW